MSTLNELMTYSGSALSSAQTLHLPSRIPLWLDLRRLLFLGWVTIEMPGYLATAKVHARYPGSHLGIAGTRIHSLYIWPCLPGSILIRPNAIYQHHCGNVIDHLDDDGHAFLNLILEYFQ